MRRTRSLAAGLIGSAALVAVAVFGSMTALATDGQMLVTKDTTLTEDHDGNITVQADNITLDCDGHTVNALGLFHGIFLDHTTGVTLKNCHVSGAFQYGIWVVEGAGNTLIENVADSNNDGFYVADSDGNTISNNVASNSSFAGIALVGFSQNNILENNDTFRNGRDGFQLLNAPNNTLVGNTANDNTDYGIFLNGANNTTVANNQTNNNGQFGFLVDGVSNTFTNNAAHLNGSVGFNDGTTDSGTSGTANTYVGNTCLQNTDAGSVPVGLCDTSGLFIDTFGHIFENAIEWLADEGITKGCNPPTNTLFCPDDNVTRGQMAAFLVRALGYADDGGGNIFSDTVGHVFEGAIDKLATAGVTKGCNPPSNTQFCPDDFVTRGQMAAFLVRALGYADDGGGDLFNDDDGHVFEAAIDKLGTAGVTKGCNPPTNDQFCPDDLVTRAQMAGFLKRALD